jgi:predicted HTH domain antitoxin
MKVRSIRVPQDIDRAIEYVSRAEKIEKNQSLRKLARVGFEYYMAKNYQEGKVTLREASELLNLTLSEAMDLFAGMGVKGNIQARDVLASLTTLGHIEDSK